jgi:hypothetical protein
MADRARPIRSEPDWFRVDGVRKGKGVVLLYADRLVSVRCYAEYVCWFAMMLLLDVVAYRIFHVIVSWLVAFFGVILGSVIGRPVDRWLAAGLVATGPGGSTVIPLDQVARLRTDRSGGLAGLFVTETLVVTTADGTEYGFAGRTGYLQADIASALASQGRDVRATPLGLEVMPQAIGNGV